MKTKYEYKKRTVSLGPALTEKELNSFGSHGWEMCGIESRGESRTYHFKREKE